MMRLALLAVVMLCGCTITTKNNGAAGVILDIHTTYDLKFYHEGPEEEEAYIKSKWTSEGDQGVEN